jgi:arylsulfatase A-like enzyme
MIANIDDNVGRLLDHLKARGLERDTLVVFMTDNGGSGPSARSSLISAAGRAAPRPKRGNTAIARSEPPAGAWSRSRAGSSPRGSFSTP